MRAQTVARMVRLQSWAAQINECQQSGLSVRQWCEENGINMKTYYNRMTKVREAVLEDMENKDNEKEFTKRSLGINKMPACSEQGNLSGVSFTTNVDTPVFAALPMMRTREPAMTVRIGECAVDIQADFEESVLEKVLRVVARI